MPYFVLNTKNYLEASGTELDRLAAIVDSAANAVEGTISNTQILLAVPAFDLRYLSNKFPRVRLLAQHLDDSAFGSTTGFLIPELAKAAGARGSLVNHSEHRLDKPVIQNIVKRMHDLEMISVVCSRDDREVGTFAKFNPDFIAIEPPELIGSGTAVSKVKPEIISTSKKVLEDSKPAGSNTRLLCGAGIVDGIDARRAIELGAEGILVASGVIRAKNWHEKIDELLQGISAAKGSR